MFTSKWGKKLLQNTAVISKWAIISKWVIAHEQSCSSIAYAATKIFAQKCRFNKSFKVISKKRNCPIDTIDVDWCEQFTDTLKTKYQGILCPNVLFQCNFDEGKIDVVPVYFLGYNIDGQHFHAA